MTAATRAVSQIGASTGLDGTKEEKTMKASALLKEQQEEVKAIFKHLQNATGIPRGFSRSSPAVWPGVCAHCGHVSTTAPQQ
jgi:hypothetical protein